MRAFTSFRTQVASWLTRGCSVERGEFGLRLVPAGEWSEWHNDFMVSRGLSEVHFNRERGFVSRGDYSFLERVRRPLIGLKIVDHEATDISSLLAHRDGLRSLDLTFVGKLKKPIAFDQFTAMERLSVLVPIPQMERVFLCSRLERLSLSRYAGRLPSDLSANLRSLKSLFLSAVNLVDLTSLRGLSKLEALTITSAKGLCSLDGLEGLSNLLDLTIESSQGLGSLRPIEGLGRIERIWLYNCGQIDTLSPLKQLASLREINLIGNTTVADGDITVLRELPHLETVCLVDRPHYQPAASAVNRKP